MGLRMSAACTPRTASWLVLAVALSLSACSMMRSTPEQTVAGEPWKAEVAGLPYYVGSAGLPLYREPGRDLVTKLPLHQKVYRTRLEKGWAYVRVEGTGQEGWLVNAKLIWRLPPKAATSPEPATAPGEAASEAAEPEATEPEAEKTGAAPPAPVEETPAPPAAEATGKPRPVSPSVFDPY
jgi:hypothetical protein